MSRQEESPKRTLSELETRAMGLLSVRGNTLSDLIEIASKKAPAYIYDLAYAKLKVLGHHADEEADQISKATRWLAIIRRDYGEEEFENVVKLIKERI